MAKEEYDKVYKAFGKIYRTGKPERGIAYKVIHKDGNNGLCEKRRFSSEKPKRRGYRLSRNGTRYHRTQANGRSSAAVRREISNHNRSYYPNQPYNVKDVIYHR